MCRDLNTLDFRALLEAISGLKYRLYARKGLDHVGGSLSSNAHLFINPHHQRKLVSRWRTAKKMMNSGWGDKTREIKRDGEWVRICELL